MKIVFMKLGININYYQMICSAENSDNRKLLYYFWLEMYDLNTFNSSINGGPISYNVSSPLSKNLILSNTCFEIFVFTR